MCEMCCNLDVAAKKDLTKKVVLEYPPLRGGGSGMRTCALGAGVPGVFGEEPGAQVAVPKLRKLWKEMSQRHRRPVRGGP